MQPESDAALIARLRHDPEALEAFYRRHAGRVAAFAAGRVADADTVADIVSATFLAALRTADRFDPVRSPDTALYWLFGIERHQIASHHRRAERQLRVAEREGARRRLTDDETARIDDLIDAQRLAPEIDAALRSLSPGVRDAFLLVTLDRVPQAAAASVLGISHAALRARLSRARLRLRRHLHAHDPSPSTPRLALAPTDLSGGHHGL